jgi:predicted P-loop ATPase
MISLKYNITLDIATAATRKAAKWQNKRATWQDIVNTLSNTERTPETIKQYFSYTKDRQDEIKDVGGFVGGYLREGRRKKGYVEYRQVVCLDVDFGDTDLWITFGLLNMAGCMYTTHKHRPESPRFRIVIPLNRRVTPDEYEAIARVVASWLGIDNFDDTTYQPTRLMYYPSTSKDGEFIFNYNDAPILDADEVLAELPDWRDPTTWPVSSRIKDVVKTSTADKMEDPEEKGGIIGAFCRAYTMYEAIAEFLDEVYAPCGELGEDRYSLIGASTSGGLVVYDNKLAFSHHATDITSGKLCNAFDLVRLHKFGDLDEKAKPDTDVTKLPSYKAMTDFAGKLGPVKKEMVRMRREAVTADDYDELENSARKTATADEWIERLTMVGKTDVVESTIDNAVIILNNDENLKDRLRLNSHSMKDEVIKPFAWDRDVARYPRQLDDNDLNQIRRYMEKCYGVKGKDTVKPAIYISSQEHSYHPIKEYLDGLSGWDGVERLDELLIRLFGAADTPYTRAVTRKPFCAAVKRIYQPGAKFDYVLVLIGEQGAGKSTFLSKMGGKWFTDNVRITDDKRDNLEIMRGRWILEIAEMRGFNKTEAEFSKGFISRTEDIYRRAYKELDVVHPRQSIFIGTHNKSDFLNDETGNRRYWPVQCTKGKEAAAEVWRYLTPEIVDQIWAEAKERVAQGETLYLDGELERVANEIQGNHLESDAWEEDVLRYVEGKKEVTTKEIWELAIQGDRPISKVDQNRIAKILRVAGWRRATIRRDGIKFKAWVR